MLYWLTGFSDGGGFFNLFNYITFRAGGAFSTALIFGFIFGRPLIDFLRRKQGKGQPIRDDGPQSHLAKAGTPTMGGLLILSALIVSTLLWARLDNSFVWIVLLVTIAFGLIGFADDYAKVSKQNTKGVSSRMRMALGLLIAALAAYASAMFHPTELTNQLAFPFFKDLLLNLGYFFVPFGMIVIVGAANAVNLTDGLDGLAIMPVMIAAATLGVIAYVVGSSAIANDLGVHAVPGTAELLIFAAGIFGAGLGFLWYNAPPAAVFMGDTGSLALGGRAGGDCGLHQARDRAGHCRRAVRRRGAERDHPGAVLQAHQEADLPDGADPPPFREEGLGRAADRDPLLDHQPDPGRDRPCNTEGPLISTLADGQWRAGSLAGGSAARPCPPFPFP
jgi:phospho-N-acetylmuramoyl-pentapeptide-transferase